MPPHSAGEQTDEDEKGLGEGVNTHEGGEWKDSVGGEGLTSGGDIEEEASAAERQKEEGEPGEEDEEDEEDEGDDELASFEECARLWRQVLIYLSLYLSLPLPSLHLPPSLSSPLPPPSSLSLSPPPPLPPHTALPLSHVLPPFHSLTPLTLAEMLIEAQTSIQSMFVVRFSGRCGGWEGH